METRRRRTSSRLRKLRADLVDDGRSGKDASSKRNSKAENQTAQKRVSQSIGRRRTCGDSESLSSLTATKRRKYTTVSKSELSVSTHTNQSMTITNRRRTRSISKQMQSKNVTPSPVPSTASNKFIFPPPRKVARRRKGSHEIPPGVINLYHDQENEIGTSLVAFESPIKPDCGKRRAHTRQGINDQQQKSFHHRVRPMTLKTGGKSSSSSTPESMTTDYIRTYGEDYWQYLHDSERPIIYDPSALKASNDIKKVKSNTETPKSGNRNNPFGSPDSRRSSSSSSSTGTGTSSSTCTSKVTPNDENCSLEETWVATDFRYFPKKRYMPQPHQSLDNRKSMSVQPQLTPKMRSILVDWLIELSEHFDFESSTLHLAVTMVDRVLASGRFLEQQNSCSTERRRTHDCFDSDESDYDENEEDNASDDTRCYMIPRDRFQLLGVTCVWLACKVHETKPPKAKEIAYVSDQIYSIEQITRMERRICNALNFSFFEAPTPHQFLFEFMRASLAGCKIEQQEDKLPAKDNSCCLLSAAATGVGLATDSAFRDMVHYLLELGRLPYGPTGRDPSLLAAAAVYLARVTMGIPRALKDATESAASAAPYSPCLASSSDSESDTSLDPSLHYWTPTLKYYTGYTQNDLRETVMEIHKYHVAAESSSLTAVFNKYKSHDYHRVALKTSVREEDLGFS